ncbi:hypothetical protein GCM10027451_20250 [Geodermatophilus aquaeductus]
MNGSVPVSVTRTCTCPPTASSVRSCTASASMPGTAGTAGAGADDDAGMDDGADADDSADPHAAHSRTASRVAVRRMRRA